MTATRTRGAGKAPGAGMWKTASDASRQAWIEHRRILVDELVQHPDVWEYIAEQARDVAADLPVGDDRTTLQHLALCSDLVAAMLERARTVGEQQAAS
jgi:hypothetical protein